MAKYNTGDYFLDYLKTLCQISKIDTIPYKDRYRYVYHIYNTKTKVTYSMFEDSIFSEMNAHVTKYLGPMDEQVAHILYGSK